MKNTAKILALVLVIAMLAAVLVACGDEKKDDSASKAAVGSKDDATEAAPADILSGTWKQTDEVNGDWTWTFDGAGKCHLTGDTTGIETDGAYTLDENAKTVTVNMELWDDEKVYDYTLEGNVLDLSSTYSNYHLIKQ